MNTDLLNVIRLVVSHAIMVYFILLMIPLRKPFKKNLIIILSFILLMTVINVFVVVTLGLAFYVRYYLLTFILPQVLLFMYFAQHRGKKVIFALLTVQIMSNLTVINGLFASYLYKQDNSPLIDLFARLFTALVLVYFLKTYIRKMYFKMTMQLNKGWWILNIAMMVSYTLMYSILFVPTPIYDRPLYFIHGYLGIFLSILIYLIIYFLFVEVEERVTSEIETTRLSQTVKTLKEETETMSSIAYKDALTDVKNRFSLIQDMKELIDKNIPFVVVFMDLDKLKEINDSFSHHTGDRYLKAFSSAAKKELAQFGEFYRFAGDEFIGLVYKNIDSFFTEAYRKNIENSFDCEITFLGFSSGLSKYPSDGSSIDELITCADQMMYIEKKNKKYQRV